MKLLWNWSYQLYLGLQFIGLNAFLLKWRPCVGLGRFSSIWHEMTIKARCACWVWIVFFFSDHDKTRMCQKEWVLCASWRGTAQVSKLSSLHPPVLFSVLYFWVWRERILAKNYVQMWLAVHMELGGLYFPFYGRCVHFARWRSLFFVLLYYWLAECNLNACRRS